MRHCADWLRSRGLDMRSNYYGGCHIYTCRGQTGSTRKYFCSDHSEMEGLTPFLSNSPAQGQQRGSTPLTGVYVIGSKAVGAIKIGIASDVIARVASLQTAFPHPLSIYSASYTGRPFAERIEAECHRVLKDLGFHLNGEWFDADPDDASDLVRKVAMDLKHPVIGPTEYHAMFDDPYGIAHHVENSIGIVRRQIKLSAISNS